MDANSFSLLVYASLLAAMGLGAVGLSALVGPRRPRAEKSAPYECGKDLITPSRTRFTVRFYLVAILFVLFDIETMFLLPWAVIHRRLGVFGLVEMGIFVGVLAVGLLYAWKRGVLDWDSSAS